MRFLSAVLIFAIVVSAVVESRRPYASDNGRTTRRSISARPRLRYNRDMRPERSDRSRVRRQGDDCDTSCGTIFMDTQFQECSQVETPFLSGSTPLANSNGAYACAATRNCSDILNKAFICIQDHCSGGTGGDLSPVIGFVLASCARDKNNNLCIDDDVKLIRDIQDRTKTAMGLITACEASNPANDCTDCVDALTYLLKTMGCCYSSFWKIFGSYTNGVTIDPNHLSATCGEFSELSRTCSFR